MISADVTIQAQFYDLDPMEVVWHGNYARYLEQARCALLDRIGYNYPDMAASGFMWPIVDMQLKYVRPIRFAQTVVVTATLAEYENRIRIDYRIRDEKTGELLTKARTVQLAVHAKTGELSFESPPILIEKVRALL
ncbi:acyl-CoA thioesterase [Azospirillum rugosum]|uniref:Acyl-CoA thioester hydrolase n=1 Tax=Azospirillum rugosum TaxID=416170 RepID=A0ABS4SHS6_9PROT|nr:thioesterase family protein [Azospirillum rugosum]MBP2292047.1 acyl-CoA thioester hydrolase [Azospirillum rugosum]MDQ0525817.1 acyl-CoA thioester hydrolase [Azospirillum rugosum]